MPDGTPRLDLPLIQQSQAQKHVTHNEALAILDLLVQLVVQDFDINTPPGSPQDGQVWALGDTPTGDWAGQASMLAARINGGWAFLTPQEGWRAIGLADGSFRRWTGAEWLTPVPILNNLPGLGVNAGYDATNRLAVSALATLLNHDGAGHQLKINKAAAGETASLLFQTDWSGRAEMGTAGNDDFAVKVSPDGAAWHDGMILDRATGQARFPNGVEVTGALTGAGAANLPGVISDGSDTGDVTTPHDRVVIAASDARASGARSVVLASDGSACSGATTFCLASDNAEIGGERCGGISANGGVTEGFDGLLLATLDSFVSGFRALVTASFDSAVGQGVSAGDAIVACSRRTVNNTSRSFALGDAASGARSTANRKIHLFAATGDIQIAGSLTSSHSFSDFAEMFPNATGVEIPPGTIVAEENGAVRPASAGDEIAGVVTATAVVTGGDTPFAWQGRYLSDEWGRPLYDAVPDPDHGGDGAAPIIKVRQENPAWDPDLPQTPRSERPNEWTRVGLLGQVFTRVAADVVPGDRLSAAGGIGVKSTSRTGLRCMTITQPYDADKGYAVARCLINVQV